VRRKDAEKRLKKKLMKEVRTEIRSDLLEQAKTVQEEQDQRVKRMEDWLM
jgi:hypothetical protein